MTESSLDAGQYRSAVNNIRKLLSQRRADDAATASKRLVELNRQSIEPLLLLAKARQQQGRFDDMLLHAEQALAQDPAHQGAQLQFAEACIFCGHHNRALQQLAALERAAGNDAVLLQHIAEFYAHIGKHEDAHRCYLRANKINPGDPRGLYNLASSLISVGELARAEQAFSRVIELNPADFDAWHNRSTLHKQTAEHNHIVALGQALQQLSAGDGGEVPLCYALAKEHEDIGDDTQSFAYLKRGADSRRKRMGYDVRNDVAVMRRIAEIFDRGYADRTQEAKARSGPIFVLGLPRSGTTLVDRIISSHSQVQSLGEINDFALALTRLGKSVNKNELLSVSAELSPDALGEEYLRSVATYGCEKAFFIDKTPANYLYIGLIAKALPIAPVIHVRRHPVDSCLAMYRTLFRMGYPFSYDMNDLADYYIAYDALMTHWRNTFPDRVLDVSYEALVDDQEKISKSIIGHCGLPWEPACLDFEQNKAPVATASAAQVRRPIYRDALARWRRYEKQLAPLIERLQEAGIAI